MQTPIPFGRVAGRKMDLVAGVAVFINKLLTAMKLEPSVIMGSLLSRLGAVRPLGETNAGEGRMRCSRRRTAAERALNHDGALDEAVRKISSIFAEKEFSTEGVVEILISDYIEEMVSFAGQRDPRKMIEILSACW